jgi:hypothetical protein
MSRKLKLNVLLRSKSRGAAGWPLIHRRFAADSPPIGRRLPIGHRFSSGRRFAENQRVEGPMDGR